MNSSRSDIHPLLLASVLGFGAGLPWPGIMLVVHAALLLGRKGDPAAAASSVSLILPVLEACGFSVLFSGLLGRRVTATPHVLARRIFHAAAVFSAVVCSAVLVLLLSPVRS